MQRFADWFYKKFLFRLVENHCEDLFLTLFYRETMTERKEIYNPNFDEIQKQAIENLRRRRTTG